jgi:hypothetical protein
MTAEGTSPAIMSASGTVRHLREPNAPLQSGEILACISVPAEPPSLDA